MDVIKSSRFWISLAICISVSVLACLKAISGSEAVAAMLGLLGGFGVAKAGGSSSVVAVLLVSALSVGGCASTAQDYLAKAHVGIQAVDKIALPQIGAKCLAEAKTCKAAGVDDPAKCDAYQKCDKARVAYKVAVDAIDAALAAVNRALTDLGVK